MISKRKDAKVTKIAKVLLVYAIRNPQYAILLRFTLHVSRHPRHHHVAYPLGVGVGGAAEVEALFAFGAVAGDDQL